jgi:hypothetical protein
MAMPSMFWCRQPAELAPTYVLLASALCHLSALSGRELEAYRSPLVFPQIGEVIVGWSHLKGFDPLQRRSAATCRYTSWQAVAAPIRLTILWV